MCVGLSATLAADIQVKTKLNKLAEQDFNIFGCVGYPAYFKSEKELRAMYWDTDGRYSSTPEGLLFKVDLNELIEFVYVAPFQCLNIET